MMMAFPQLRPRIVSLGSGKIALCMLPLLRDTKKKRKKELGTQRRGFISIEDREPESAKRKQATGEISRRKCEFQTLSYRQRLEKFPS